MNALTIEHNGRQLAFREDDESWSCFAMGMTAKSLKALKAKLDKFDGQARRVSVAALVIDSYGKPEPVQIVMIAKPKDWEVANYTTRQRAPSVWVTRARGNEQERRKVRLDAVIDPTPDNRLILNAALDKLAAADRAKKAALAEIADIPRMTIEQLTAKSVTEDDLDDAA